MKSQILDLKELYETEYDRWLSEMVRLLKNRQLDKLSGAEKSVESQPEKTVTRENSI
jgi:hypothetical protein